MKEMTNDSHTLKVDPDGCEHLQCLGHQPNGTRGSTMVRINMIRQDTRHPDKHRRHPGRAICEVADRTRPRMARPPGLPKGLRSSQTSKSSPPWLCRQRSVTSL